MQGSKKVLFIILIVMTVLVIAIDIFELVTKGTLPTWYLIATAACVLACIADILDAKKNKK